MADMTHNMTLQKLETSNGTVVLNLSIRSLFGSESAKKEHKTFEDAAAELRKNIVRSPLPTPAQIADFVQGEIKKLKADAEKSAKNRQK